MAFVAWWTLLRSAAGVISQPASGHFDNHLGPRALCSERVLLSLSSSLLRPDPPLSTAPPDFPSSLVIQEAFARRPGLGCCRDLPCFGSVLRPRVPSPLRREEKQVPIPAATLLPWPSSLLNGVGSSTIPASASAGSSSRRFKQWFASLRPAWSLALLDRSDLEKHRPPAAEDFVPELSPRKVTLPVSRALLHGTRGGRRDRTFPGWSTAGTGCTQEI